MAIKKKILFVGGGTGGHIFPLLPLIEKFKENGWDTALALADADLDKQIAQENFPDQEIFFLETTKIDYFFSWRNFLAPGKILGGFLQAYHVIKNYNPDVVFLKGGFVSFSVIPGLLLLNLNKKIHIYSHESDTSVGIPGQIIRPFCDKVFESFGHTPYPLFYQTKTVTKTKEKTKKTKLNILIFGGSQGSLFLNQTFQKNAKKILEKFSVTLVTGPGKQVDLKAKNFQQYEILPAVEFANKINEADIVIGRSGASVFQLLEQKKKCLLIPLPSSARNHQLYNAHSFDKKNLAYLLEEKDIKQNSSLFFKTVVELSSDKKLEENIKKADIKNSDEKIFKEILGEVA